MCFDRPHAPPRDRRPAGLICAIWLGAHTALLSRHAPDQDPRALATAQMLAMAALFLLLWPLAGPLKAPPREVWFAIVLTGIVASALAFAVQSAAQQHLPTSRAAILLATEPLFAGLFGYLLAGDRLGALQVVGAVLISRPSSCPRRGRSRRQALSLFGGRLLGLSSGCAQRIEACGRGAGVLIRRALRGLPRTLLGEGSAGDRRGMTGAPLAGRSRPGTHPGRQRHRRPDVTRASAAGSDPPAAEAHAYDAKLARSVRPRDSEIAVTPKRPTGRQAAPVRQPVR
jgi:uncharacterized membrane protein